jgi:hypothetical protein
VGLTCIDGCAQADKFNNEHYYNSPSRSVDEWGKIIYIYYKRYIF